MKIRFALIVSVGVMVAAYVVVSRSADNAPARRPPSHPSHGTVFRDLSQEISSQGSSLPGTVSIYAAGQFRASEAVTLKVIEPLDRSPGLDLLSTRLAFAWREATGQRGNFPISVCTTVPRWPPVGYGPTDPVANTAVAPGDEVVPIFYVRPTGAGDLTSTGVRIVYSKDGVEQTQEFDNVSYTMVVRDSAADLPDDQPQCAEYPTSFLTW